MPDLAGIFAFAEKNEESGMERFFRKSSIFQKQKKFPAVLSTMSGYRLFEDFAKKQSITEKHKK